MHEKYFDVIIIVGGSAGLFAGIVCTRNNLKTLILEKMTYPIDKACGKGIMPIGVKHLRELVIAPLLEKYPFRDFK